MSKVWKHDPWDNLDEEEAKVIAAVNKLKKNMPEETKIVTDYMIQLVKKLDMKEELKGVNPYIKDSKRGT